MGQGGDLKWIKEQVQAKKRYNLTSYKKLFLKGIKLAFKFLNRIRSSFDKDKTVFL